MPNRFEHSLAHRFSENQRLIVRLEVTNADFRDLCRDYEECVRVLETLTSDPLADPQRIGEYQDLKVALEAEALDFFESSP